MALGFLQMVPSVAQLREKWVLLNFYIGPTNLRTSLVCQVGMFTPCMPSRYIFNLPHFLCVPTSCTLCFILYHGETVRRCGAASGYMYSSLAFLCKQLPTTLALGEFSVQAGNLSLPFLLHMALSLLMIPFKTIWCQQLTFRAAQWICCINVGWVGRMFSTVLLFMGK